MAEAWKERVNHRGWEYRDQLTGRPSFAGLSPVERPIWGTVCAARHGSSATPAFRNYWQASTACHSATLRKLRRPLEELGSVWNCESGCPGITLRQLDSQFTQRGLFPARVLRRRPFPTNLLPSALPR